MTVDELDELLRKYDGQAFQVALNMLGDCYDDACDAVQEARIACWESVTNYDPDKGSFCDWWLGIVRNCCQQLYKRRQRSADWMSIDEVDEIVASPLDQLIDREERSYLHGAVDALPPQQAKAVRMRYLEDCEYAEIAAVMGVSESTTRTHLRDGLKNLRERIGNVGFLGA